MYKRQVDTTAPTAPTGLTVTGTTATTVTLTWTASTDAVGVTGYDVYRGTTLVGTVAGTTYTDSGLTAGSGPTYTVRARDAAGNVSAASAAVTAIVRPASDTQAPTVPTALTVAAKTTSSLSLSWTASTDNVGVSGYDVYRGTALVGASSGTAYTDSGLTGGTAYTYTVRARDVAGNTSAASAAVTATTTTGSTGSGAACTAAWHTDNSWNGGFTASVTVTSSGTVATKSWIVTWTWAGSEKVVNGWNATLTSSGAVQTAVNAVYNGSLAPSAATSFGLQGAASGTLAAPVLTCTAT